MMPAAIHTCPHCQAAVELASKQSEFATCRHCGGLMTVAEGKAAQKLAQPKARPGTNLLVQLGSTGQYNKIAWEATGRACCYTDDGWENWWTLLMADGSKRLLYEKRGRLLLLQPLEEEIEKIKDLLGRIKISTGHTSKAGNRQYRLQRHATGRRMELEGEGFLPDNDGQFDTYYLQSTDGLYIVALKIGDRKGWHLWQAEAVRPEALFLSPTEIKGHGDTTLHCLKCSKPTLLKSGHIAAACSCGNCGAQYRLTKEGLANPSKGDIFTKIVLPLHATGLIDGVAYTVCGMAEKSDLEGYRWREYTLFGPQGYAWLSEYDGHWTFLQEQLKAPVVDPNQDSFRHEGLRFDLFNKYTFVTHSTLGEFAEVVFAKEEDTVKEFISPPHSWVQETDANGHTWLKGRHISQKELKKAFGEMMFPDKTGVGAVQPALFNWSSKFFYTIMAAAVLGFLVIHTLTASMLQQKTILKASYQLPDTLATPLPAIVTEPFRLDKWSSNLQFDISAPVSNDWLELGVELTNLDNGKEYGLEKGVEYYSGYEGGESWSEGGRTTKAWISSLPPGRYSLQFQPARGSTNVREFSVKVSNDMPVNRNLISMLVILAILSVVYWLYSHYFENSRWRNSPFGNTGNE
jgi:hypothetical protein